MAKRKDLRNPDILPFDYVSVLLNWKTNTLGSNNPTLTVSKILKGTFPFGANVLSVTALDNSSTISFVFQSPFDINTSPWQFELEVAFTATVSKFRPTAVFNGSNNQITVKFNISTLTANTSYPVVFTAKRYRPTTQYLAQLATASQSPVTINPPAGNITSNLVYGVTSTGGINFILGHYFQAPVNFVINSVQYPFNITASDQIIVRIIRLPSLNSSTFTSLFLGSAALGVSTVPVNLTINTNEFIGIFCINLNGGLQHAPSFYIGVGITSTVTIAGISTTLYNTTGDTSDINTFSGLIYTQPRIGIPNVNITTAGGTAWSNILY